jgi:hypothetical protein
MRNRLVLSLVIWLLWLIPSIFLNIIFKYLVRIELSEFLDINDKIVQVVTLFISFIITYFIYKILWKKISLLKIDILKLYIKINRISKKIDKVFTNDTVNQVAYNTSGSILDRSIKIWKFSIKKESNNLLSSISLNQRQIVGDNIMLILKNYSNQEYILSILNTSEKSSFYEIYIENNIAKELIKMFDESLENRLIKIENEKRNIINNNIDTLIVSL